MKKIYAFDFNCGRIGSLDGLFIADDSEVEKIMGKEIYFGEVLGKHSEIYGPLEKKDLTVKTDDQDFISKFIEIMGEGTISGYNPIEYYNDMDHDEDEDE